MKELSINGKATRYDEALEKARQLCAYPTTKPFISDLQDIFPELAESEDERMIQYFKDLAPFDKADELYEKYGFSHKDAISWLEKQGGHAKFINGIQVGDKVTRNEDGVLVNLSQLNRVAKKQCEQKLYVNNNAKEMFIKALERVEEQNNKGYKLTDCDKNSWWEDFKTYCGYIEIQKPAWNEEDELIVSKILCICNDFERSFECSPSSTKVIKEDVDKIDTWLKSIKDKYTWKPSDEQINTLEYYMHTLICNEHKEILFGLYTDLKKLKG